MKLDNDQKEYITQQLYRLGLKIVKEAKMRCPVDTGRLRSSITTKVTNDFKVKVGSNVSYAPMIEFGTEPHVIEPDTAEALNWEDEEGEHFAKKVNHPGIESRSFLRPAIDKVIRGN